MAHLIRLIEGEPMLSFWRKRKNFAVHLVFWPIIAVFVIWGFERYGNPLGSAAAVVNDHTISIAEYRNAVQRQVEFYTQVFQGNFDEKTQEQYHIKERALSQLVDTELVSEEAEIMGLTPTDAEVRDTIILDPYLQKDGKFSRDNYDMALRNMHLSPAQFEAEQRRSLVVGRITRLFEENLSPSKLEIEKLRELHSEKKDVEFLKIDKDQLVSSMKFSPKEIDNYLKSESNLKSAKEYYELHQSEFSTPEEVRATHILVKNSGKDGDDIAAKEKIMKIKGEVTPQNFSELAKKYSDDPGSKSKGGELGWFGRGRMVPEFDKAAFAAEVGKISEPVKTSYGYHLILVEEKHPLKREAFDEVKSKIANKFLAREKIDKVFAENEKKMSTDPTSSVHDFESLISPKPKWEETGMFSLADDTIPKLGENADLLGAAIAVSNTKPIYPKLIKDGSTYYVVRFKKSEAATPPDQKKLVSDLESATGRDIFTAWNALLREKAKITVNPQLQDVAGGGDQSDGDM